MNNTDDVLAPIWLEGYGKHRSNADVNEHAYLALKFKLDKKLVQSLQILISQKKLKWEVLVYTAAGILFNRFSSADNIYFSSGKLLQSKKNILSVNPKLVTIQSSINSQKTIHELYTDIDTHLKDRNFLHDIDVTPRYLVLLADKADKNKAQNKKSLVLDAYAHPLVIVTNKEPALEFSIYFSNHFTELSIETIFNDLSIVLQDACDDMNQAAASINMMSDIDRKHVLSTWSHPTYHFKTEPVTRCAHELFTDIAKKSPNSLAIAYSDAAVSYEQLDSASTKLANKLMEYGIKIGDPVCVLMDRTPTILMAMMAIFKCGAIYTPINPKYPPEKIDYVIEDTKARCILVNDAHRVNKKYRDVTLEMTEEWQTMLARYSSTEEFPKGNPDRIAYIIYTSGTTGNPKGVMIKHKSLMNLIDWYRGCFNVTEKDRSSQFASQGFDPFFCETIPFLSTGGSVHIIDDSTKLTPSLFFSWMEKEKITICDLPTAYAQMLFSMTWPSKLALKTLKIGGESVTRYLTQNFTFDIWDGYGPTETTVESTYFKLYSAQEKHHISHKYDSPPIGKPITGTEVYIVDKNLQPVPPGIAGELLIGGHGVAAGYLNRDDLTNEKFIHNIFNKHPISKLYRTGDLARWLPDGNLEYIGRLDHQIKIRGYRIELGEIEKSLNQYPDVNEVVVLAKENVSGEKSLIAYVVPNLDKQRYLYQERCLVSISPNKYIEAITEDISKNGVAISGISETLRPGQTLHIHIKLPGSVEVKQLTGHLVWQNENRTGIAFSLNDHEKEMVSKSIDYYLATHNAMELVLSASAKRSLRKALKGKLPEYMIPSAFVTLMQFPITFSGKIDVKSLPPPQNFERALQSNFIAPVSNTEKELTVIWKKLLHKDNISISDSFFDLGGSSLTVAELSVKILEQFDISIPTKLLFDLPYISVLAEYIDSNGSAYSTHTSIQDEIERDVQLHENINPTQIISKSISEPEHILLTGAGGFLGIYLLRELLASTSAKIYCLIRKGDQESAAKRLSTTIKRFQLEKDVSLTDRRIVVIPSDLSFENFGLPHEQYENLAQKVDMIFHCGAQVNIMAAYSNLRNSNVQGTLEIIKFATKYIDKPIHYVSTLSAATMKNAAGLYSEEFPDEEYDDLFGGYAISKWISERLLTQINHRGLPITIYRSGYISGQTSTGIINLNDALFMLIKGCIQLGFAPEMNEKITILPVDFVSRMVTGISLANPTQSSVYHVDHPSGILWRDLVAWLNDYGYKIKLIPMSEWQQLLTNLSKDNAVFPFIPYYLSLKDDYSSPEADVTHASDALDKLGLTYPTLDDQLLRTYFDYLSKIEFLPQTNRAASR